MTMQYDVKQGHLNSSGFFVLGRNRVKGISFFGSGTDGTLVLFDTITAPVTSSVTYARSTTTVTVTKTAHGLVSGDTVGIHFNSASSESATDGNYVITVVNSSSFTLTDINSGTIGSSTVASYVSGGGRWLMTYEIDSTDTFSNAPVIPGEGVLVVNGIYALMLNIDSAQIFYG
jgi:hypothetical protein